MPEVMEYSQPGNELWSVYASRVTKIFPGSRRVASVEALTDLDLVLKDGDFYCMVGPSGCGKTTALKLLSGIDQPTRGQIEIHGEKIRGPGPDRGVIFQQPTLYPWLTVKHNILFGPKVQGIMNNERTRTRYHELIEVTGLKDSVDRYPHQLSGGMRQRVAVARALICEPSVLFADEPFAALDAQTRAVMQQEFLKVWEYFGITVVFITHDIEEAVLLGDRVGVMGTNPGRIIEDIKVDIPRPRNAEVSVSPRFVDIKRRILDVIRPKREIAINMDS